VGGSYLTIAGNYALPTCEACDLLDQLWGLGFYGTFNFSGNKPDTCPDDCNYYSGGT